MKVPIVLFLSCLLCFSVYGQVELGPSIGIGDLPTDDTPICDIPLYLGNFHETGFQSGELIPDFTLYDLDGEALVMSELLDQGKPVLLIAGNYTCPVFRNKIDVINDLVNTYPDELEVIIVYGLEAHPDIDISPYFGYVNTGNGNISAGILYQQPTTYGERKTVLQDMVDDINIDARIVIDGPCNEWWASYGPAPNNAYLIGTDGYILNKHPWFDKHPFDIYCDLETYLDLPADCGNTTGGAFTFELTGAPAAEGPAGSTIYVTGLLSNNSDEGVEIQMAKLEVNLPSGWASSICTDVCYPSTVDTAFLFLEAGESLTYTQYFYTDDTPASGTVKMGFRNTADFSNAFQQTMMATSSLNTSTVEVAPTSVQVFPNPARPGSLVNIRLEDRTDWEQFELIDSKGNRVLNIEGYGLSVFRLPDVSTGVYWYRCQLSNGSTLSGRLLVQ